MTRIKTLHSLRGCIYEELFWHLNCFNIYMRKLILTIFILICASSSFASSAQSQLLKAMNIVEMARSLTQVEMGSSSETELKRAKHILDKLNQKELSKHQIQKHTSLLVQIDALLENTRTSLSSCDYFDLVADKEREIIRDHIEKKQIFVGQAKLTILLQKTNKKSYCPQYSSWSSEIKEIIDRV